MIFSLAVRNTLRNRRRSALTAATVMLGTGLLIVGISWMDGVFGGVMERAAAAVGHVRIVNAKYAQKEQLFPIYENLPETAPLEESIQKVPGVTGVYTRISMPATLTVGEEIGEVFGLVQGAPSAYFTEIMDLDTHISEGKMLSGDKEAVIGATLAEELKAKVGDELIVLGQTQDGSFSPIKVNITGIADMGNGGQNKMVYITLEKARYMADIPDGGVEILVYGTDRFDGQTLAAAIQPLPGFEKAEVKSWDQRSPFAEMLGFFDTIRYMGAGIVVFITALSVLNTMLMSVLERTAEIGVLRAMGLRRPQTILLFMTEAMCIAAVGGVLGMGLGGLGGWLLETHGLNLGSAVDSVPSAIPVNSVMYGDINATTLVRGFVLGLLMAVIGSILPALRATTIQPVEAMRARR